MSEQRRPGSTSVDASFTLRELMIWCVVFSLVFASPRWLGQGSVLLSFYGLMSAVTWRLSRHIHFVVAWVCGFLLATLVSILLVTFAWPL